MGDFGKIENIERFSAPMVFNIYLNNEVLNDLRIIEFSDVLNEMEKSIIIWPESGLIFRKEWLTRRSYLFPDKMNG